MLPELYFLSPTNNRQDIPRGATSLTHMGYGLREVSEETAAGESSKVLLYRGGEDGEASRIAPGDLIRFSEGLTEPITVVYPAASGRAIIAVGRRGTEIESRYKGHFKDGGIVPAFGLTHTVERHAMLLHGVQDYAVKTLVGFRFKLLPPIDVLLSAIPLKNPERGIQDFYDTAEPAITKIVLLACNESTGGAGDYTFSIFGEGVSTIGTETAITTLVLPHLDDTWKQLIIDPIFWRGLVVQLDETGNVPTPKLHWMFWGL